MHCAAWGADPAGTKYGFEDDVRLLLHPSQVLFLIDPRADPALVSLLADPSACASRSGEVARLIETFSYFSGHQNKDVAFFHPASKSLIEADLLFNLPPTEQVRFPSSLFFFACFRNTRGR